MEVDGLYVIVRCGVCRCTDLCADIYGSLPLWQKCLMINVYGTVFRKLQVLNVEED